MEPFDKRKALLLFPTQSKEAEESLRAMDLSNVPWERSNYGQYGDEPFDSDLEYESSDPAEKEANARRILAKYQSGLPVTRQESDYFSFFFDEEYIKSRGNKNFFSSFYAKYGPQSDLSQEYYAEFSAKKAYRDYQALPQEEKLFESEDFKLSSEALFEKIRSKPEKYGVVKPFSLGQDPQKRVDELRNFNAKISELVEKRNLILAGSVDEETSPILKPLVLGSLFVANSLLEAVKGFAGLGGKAVDLFDDAKKFVAGDDLKREIEDAYQLDDAQKKTFEDYLAGDLKITRDKELAARGYARKGGELDMMTLFEKLSRPGPIIGKFDPEDVPVPVVLEDELDPKVLAAIYEYTFKKAKHFTAGERAMMEVQSWQDAISRAALPEIELERLKKAVRLQTLEKDPNMGFFSKHFSMLKEHLSSEDLFLRDLPVLAGAGLQALATSRASRLLPAKVADATIFKSPGIKIPKTTLRVGKGSLTLSEALGVAVATSYEADIETLGYKGENVSKITTLEGVDYFQQGAGVVKAANYLLAFGTAPWLRFERSIRSMRASATKPLPLETTKFKVPEKLDVPKTKRALLASSGKRFLWEAFTEGLEESYQEAAAITGQSLFEQRQEYGGEWTFNRILAELQKNKDRIVSAGIYGSVLGSIGTLPGFYPLYKSYTSDVYKPVEQTSFYKKYSDKAYVDAYVEKRRQEYAKELESLNKEKEEIRKALSDDAVPLSEKAIKLRRLTQLDTAVQKLGPEPVEGDLKAEYFKELKERAENVKTTGYDFTEKQLFETAEKVFDMKIESAAAMAALIRGVDPQRLLQLSTTKSTIEALNELDSIENAYDKQALKSQGFFDQRLERFKRLALGEEILGFAFHNADVMFAMNNLSRLMASSEDEQYKQYVLDNMENELLAETYSYMLRRSASNPETLDFLKRVFRRTIEKFSESKENEQRAAELSEAFSEIDRQIDRQLEDKNFKKLKKDIDKVLSESALKLKPNVKDVLAYEIALQKGAVLGMLTRYTDKYRQFIEAAENTERFVETVALKDTLKKDEFELLKTKRFRFLEELKNLAESYETLKSKIHSKEFLKSAVKSLEKSQNFKNGALVVPTFMTSLKEHLKNRLAKFNFALKQTETAMESLYPFIVESMTRYDTPFLPERTGNALLKNVRLISSVFLTAKIQYYADFLPENERKAFVDAKEKATASLEALIKKFEWATMDHPTFLQHTKNVYAYLEQIRKVLLEEYLETSKKFKEAVVSEIQAKDIVAEIASVLEETEPPKTLKNPHLDSESHEKIEQEHVKVVSLETEREQVQTPPPPPPSPPSTPSDVLSSAEALKTFQSVLQEALSTLRSADNIDTFFDPDKQDTKEINDNQTVLDALSSVKNQMNVLLSSPSSSEASEQLVAEIRRNVEILSEKEVYSFKFDKESKKTEEELQEKISEKIVPFLKNFLEEKTPEEKKDVKEQKDKTSKAIEDYFGGFLAKKFLPDPYDFRFVKGSEQDRKLYNVPGNLVNVQGGTSVDIVPDEPESKDAEFNKKNYNPSLHRHVVLVPNGFVDQQGNEHVNVLELGPEAIKRYTVFSETSDWAGIIKETVLEQYKKFYLEAVVEKRQTDIPSEFSSLLFVPQTPKNEEQWNEVFEKNKKQILKFVSKLINFQVGNKKVLMWGDEPFIWRVTQEVAKKVPVLIPKVYIKSDERTHEYVMIGWNDIVLSQGDVKIVASNSANMKTRVLNFLLHALVNEEEETGEERKGWRRNTVFSGMSYGWLFQKRISKEGQPEKYKEYSRIVDDLFPVNAEKVANLNRAERKSLEDVRVVEAVKTLLAAVDSEGIGYGEQDREGKVTAYRPERYLNWKADKPLKTTFINLVGVFFGMTLPRKKPVATEYAGSGGFFPFLNPYLSKEAKETVFMHSWTWLISEIFSLNQSKKGEDLRLIFDGLFGKEAFRYAGWDEKNLMTIRSNTPFFKRERGEHYGSSRMPYADYVDSKSENDPAIGYLRLNENEVLVFRKSNIEEMRPVKGNPDRRMEPFGGSPSRTAYVMAVLSSPKASGKEEFKDIGDATQAIRALTLSDVENINRLPNAPQSLKAYASKVAAVMRTDPTLKTQAEFEMREYVKLPVFMLKTNVALHDYGQVDFKRMLYEELGLGDKAYRGIPKGTKLKLKIKGKEVEYVTRYDITDAELEQAAYAVLADTEADWKVFYDAETQRVTLTPTARYRLFWEPVQYEEAEIKKLSKNVHKFEKKQEKKETKKEYKVDYGTVALVIDFPEELAGKEDYEKPLWDYIYNSEELDQLKEFYDAVKDAVRRAAEGDKEVLLPRLEINLTVNYPYEPLRKNLMAPLIYMGKNLGPYIDRVANKIDRELVTTFYDAEEGVDEKGNPKTFHTAKPSLETGLSREITFPKTAFLELIAISSEKEFLSVNHAKLLLQKINPRAMIANILVSRHEEYQNLAKTSKFGGPAYLESFLKNIKSMMC
jgi:hypothetical protein